MQRIKAGARAAVLLALTAAAAACGIESQKAPALIGPSGSAQSVTLAAVPDRLPRDGVSQAVVTVTVRNDQGQAVSGLRVTLGSSIGVLSQSDVVTGNDGRASFTVTAPPTNSVGQVIEVFATPLASNFDDAMTRSLTIALTGPTNSSAPTPRFTIDAATPAASEPTAVELLADVVFDATQTTDEGRPCLDNCAYAWDFGDGRTATGRTVVHQYRETGTRVVRLTVTDGHGSWATLSVVVLVEEGNAPTADFAYSPSEPAFDEPVFFDAGLSAPAAGNAVRSPIVEYVWSFGDSEGVVRTSSRLVQHTFSRPSGALRRTFRVVLTVIDGAGRQASRSQDVTVGDRPEEEPDEE